MDLLLYFKGGNFKSNTMHTRYHSTFCKYKSRTILILL